ncbi:MAG: adenylosuccinate lyase [Microbacteriaceae bacterium]|nr:adenylosuccinate lyase [Microbacteriaceae bacterium]
MEKTPVWPLSPLDGRYREAVAPLATQLSEFGLNRTRILVEVEWLIFLTDRGLFGSKAMTAEHKEKLRSLSSGFNEAEARLVATHEAKTRHDVKAVEYYLRDKLKQFGITGLDELVHFAATSEDINNLSYALTIRAATLEIWLPRVGALLTQLKDWARASRTVAMLSHTHGQPATPTTLGKELAVFAHRLERVADQIGNSHFLGKFNGATGTYSAHLVADPDQDWVSLSREFVESLGLEWNPLTTQIESHDWQVELYGRIAHLNRILHNLCTDFWTYISIGYFTQVPQPGATGSSTMPHKVNPIRFENAEANLELSCAILDSLAATLVTSRLQRDLTDSSSQRNIGVGFGHSLVAIENIISGLKELHVDESKLRLDLDENWEVLAEAIQTVIRAEITQGRSKITDPYALLKELTRGKRLDAEQLRDFITGLDIGADAKERLLALTPNSYTGLADKLVDFLD